MTQTLPKTGEVRAATDPEIGATGEGGDDGVRQPRAEAGIDPKKDSNDDISRNDPVNWYPDGRKYKKY